jgi:hypothetical protein
MIWRWDLRILRHSSADRRVGREPLVNPSARAPRRTSVPCSGRRRSVEGRLENMRCMLGKVNVDRICIYRDSSCVLSCKSLSPNLLIAARFKCPFDKTTNLAFPVVNPRRLSSTS